MDIVLYHQTTILSDGSPVHNVITEHTLILHAVTEADALALAAKIKAAIDEHTVDACVVRECDETVEG